MSRFCSQTQLLNILSELCHTLRELVGTLSIDTLSTEKIDAGPTKFAVL